MDPPAKIHHTASLEKSLEDLSIKNKKHDLDIARLSLTGASDTSNTEKKDTKPKKKSRKTAVADSWEDELSDGSSSATETDERKNGPAVTATNVKDSLVAKEGPLAPPPTPSTVFDEQDDTDGLHPRWSNVSPTKNTTRSATTSSFMTRDQEQQPRARPEKQTAVASRMIAGALGIRAPKRTEEQRAYDRAMKEKEIKRRNKEKEEAARAKEDEERAKAAVWDS